MRNLYHNLELDFVYVEERISENIELNDIKYQLNESMHFNRYMGRSFTIDCIRENTG